MNSDQSPHPKYQEEFGGCVELIPPPRAFMEFITANRLWGVPIGQLDYFMLGANPEQARNKSLPPDLLVLVFMTRIVVLFGWRLEGMVGPLVSGRVARVHAEKPPGATMPEEPWVSEIKIIPRFDSVPL